MEPRLFPVTLVQHVTFRIVPYTSGYVRVEVAVIGSYDEDVERFRYDDLTLEEAMDVMAATLRGLTS